MTEEKKHAILFVTTLLCTRKIIDLVDTSTLEGMGKTHWLGVFEKEVIDQVVQAMDKLMSDGPRKRSDPEIVRRRIKDSSHLYWICKRLIRPTRSKPTYPNILRV